MSRLFYHVMQDNLGNLLFDVSGTMRLAGSGTLATIYGDEALTVVLPNPMTNHPSFGSFKCYLAASASGYDFYMAKSGYTFETLTGVQGWGTMAQQNAAAVAITGGSATGLSFVSVTAPANQFALAISNPPAGTLGGIVSSVAAGTNRWNLYANGTAPNLLTGPVGLQMIPFNYTSLTVGWLKASQNGAWFQPIDSDSGGQAIQFANLAGVSVGSVATTATTTAYNTTSDARLKTAVEIFTDALDLVRQLRPVRFRWRADASDGQGFLANEVQQVIDGVVTGEPDAMNEDGSISPQQIDHSKLVPLLTAAVKELMARVEALEAAATTP